MSALVGLLVLTTCHSVRAQLSFIPPGSLSPQAKTADELDEYGLVFESANPQKTMRLGRQFLKNYPDSEFRVYTIILEMHAYELMNDYNGVLTTGQECLKISPQNIDVLTTLANALANNPSSDAQSKEKALKEAEADAREAQGQLERLVRPFSVPRSQFGSGKRKTQAEIAAVLGLIALQRSDFGGAISEYEHATALAPQPRGVDFYRLGIAYLMTGQHEKGIQRLERAMSLGPPLISALAQHQIDGSQKTYHLNKK
jgi:tetratricopeptide (TPR) repeat protein